MSTINGTGSTENSAEINVEVCKNILIKLKQLKKEALKSRFELAEMQTQIMLLYKQPYLEILKPILGSHEVNDSMEVDQTNVQVNKDQ